MRNSALVAAILIVSSVGYAWERTDGRLVQRSDLFTTVPRFSVMAEKPKYVLHEPIRLKFTLTNPSSVKLLTYMDIVEDPVRMGKVRLDIVGPDSHVHPLFSRTSSTTAFLGYMAAREVLTNVYSESYVMKQPGRYSIKASYLWRPTALGTDYDPEALVNADEVSILVEAPVGVDKDAADFVGNDVLLLQLQDHSWARRMDEGHISLAPLRRTFLDRFSGSSYSAATLLALASGLREEGDYAGAVSGYREYLRDHANDWMAQEALLGLTESLVELKRTDEAREVIQQLLSRQDLTAAASHRAGRIEVPDSSTNQPTIQKR